METVLTNKLQTQNQIQLYESHESENAIHKQVNYTRAECSVLYIRVPKSVGLLITAMFLTFVIVFVIYSKILFSKKPSFLILNQHINVMLARYFIYNS